MAGLFFFHSLMAGDGEFLTMDALSDGERGRGGEEVGGFGVATLLMGRYGIVDLGLHAMIGKVLLELVTTGAEHGEDMIYGVALALGNGDEGIAYLLHIDGGNLFAALVGSIEVFELGIEDGGLQLIHATVATEIVEDIVAGRAVVAEGTKEGCQLIIIGSDGTGIAKGAEVLGGIERVGSGMAERASHSPFRGLGGLTAVCLGIVLDEFEVVFPAQLPYPIGIGTAAIEVDNHDGTGARGDGLFDELVVNLQRVDVGLYEDGLETVFRNGKDAGDIGIGRYNDFVALVEDAHLHIGTEDEGEGIEAIATAYAVLGADILGIVLFEATGSLTLEVPPTLQPLVGSMLVGFVDGFQV